MKIYIYNNNNLNEFVEEIQTEDIELYEGCYTTIQNVSCSEPFKSYAYNVETSGWTDLIDDYRNVTIYSIYDSRYFKISNRTALQDAFTTVAPPTSGQFYKFINGSWVKQQMVTKETLMEKVYKAKCDCAYGGVYMSISGVQYLFETDQKSITLCNSTYLQFTTPAASIDGNIATVNWKAYRDGVPSLVTLTANQFCSIFTFGLRMINEAFGVEGLLNAEIEAMTDSQLSDSTFVQNFYSHIEEKFGEINKIISVS